MSNSSGIILQIHEKKHVESETEKEDKPFALVRLVTTARGLYYDQDIHY